MNSKQRMLTLLKGEIPDRVGRMDAPWPETRARWHREGLPRNKHANDFFAMDVRHMLRIDSSFRLPGSVQEDSPDYTIAWTADGVLEKQWKHSGVPQPLEYSLKSAADWKRLRGNLAPSVDRFSFGYYGDYGFEYVSAPFPAVKKAYQECRTNAETCMLVAIADPFECFMGKIGDENILIMLVTEPELLAEMFDAHVAFAKAQFDLLIAEGFKPDAVFLGADVSYKNGLLFSPALYRQLLMPRHKAMIDHFKKAHGLRVILHSDGNCTQAVPMFIEAGIDCLQPVEVSAGMDVRKLAPQFGDKIAFMGNLSVQALAGDEKRVREEVESKVRFMAKNRYRFIAHSDHSVPPEVSFANYSLAMDIVSKEGNY